MHLKLLEDKIIVKIQLKDIYFHYIDMKKIVIDITFFYSLRMFKLLSYNIKLI